MGEKGVMWGKWGLKKKNESVVGRWGTNPLTKRGNTGEGIGKILYKGAFNR